MRAKSAILTALALGVLMSASSDLRAQRTEPFGISKIDVSYEKFKGSFKVWPKGKPASALRFEEWMEVDVEFRAEPDDVQGDFFDEIEVRIHVLTPEDKKGELKREVFTAEMRYAPVPKAKTLYAVAYLPPVVLERYGGKSAWENGANVAAEVFYKGRPVAEMELKDKGGRAGDEGWYTRGGKKGVLLNRSKTPFALDSWDRYLPEVEAGR